MFCLNQEKPINKQKISLKRFQPLNNFSHRHLEKIETPIYLESKSHLLGRNRDKSIAWPHLLNATKNNKIKRKNPKNITNIKQEISYLIGNSLDKRKLPATTGHSKFLKVHNFSKRRQSAQLVHTNPIHLKHHSYQIKDNSIFQQKLHDEIFDSDKNIEYHRSKNKSDVNAKQKQTRFIDASLYNQKIHYSHPVSNFAKALKHRYVTRKYRKNLHNFTNFLSDKHRIFRGMSNLSKIFNDNHLNDGQSKIKTSFVTVQDDSSLEKNQNKSAKRLYLLNTLQNHKIKRKTSQNNTNVKQKNYYVIDSSQVTRKVTATTRSTVFLKLHFSKRKQDVYQPAHVNLNYLKQNHYGLKDDSVFKGKAHHKILDFEKNGKHYYSKKRSDEDTKRKQTRFKDISLYSQKVHDSHRVSNFAKILKRHHLKRKNRVLTKYRKISRKNTRGFKHFLSKKHKTFTGKSSLSEISNGDHLNNEQSKIQTAFVRVQGDSRFPNNVISDLLEENNHTINNKYLYKQLRQSPNNSSLEKRKNKIQSESYMMIPVRDTVISQLRGIPLFYVNKDFILKNNLSFSENASLLLLNSSLIEIISLNEDHGKVVVNYFQILPENSSLEEMKETNLYVHERLLWHESSVCGIKIPVIIILIYLLLCVSLMGFTFVSCEFFRKRRTKDNEFKSVPGTGLINGGGIIAGTISAIFSSMLKKKNKPKTINSFKTKSYIELKKSYSDSPSQYKQNVTVNSLENMMNKENKRSSLSTKHIQNQNGKLLRHSTVKIPKRNISYGDLQERHVLECDSNELLEKAEEYISEISRKKFSRSDKIFLPQSMLSAKGYRHASDSGVQYTRQRIYSSADKDQVWPSFPTIPSESDKS